MCKTGGESADNRPPTKSRSLLIWIGKVWQEHLFRGGSINWSGPRRLRGPAFYI